MTELELRRGELLARIAAQRDQMSEIGVGFRMPLSLADRGVEVARFLRSHPLLAAGVIAIVVFHRRSVTALMARLLGVWKGFRYLTLL
jgi:hypothetical protein